MAHGRWYPTVTVLGDGRVMTFSGLSETGSTNTAVEFYTARANFVMVDAGGRAGALAAHFAANRILLAGPFPPLGQYGRVSIGRSAEMHEFWRVWDLMPGMHHM